MGVCGSKSKSETIQPQAKNKTSPAPDKNSAQDTSPTSVVATVDQVVGDGLATCKGPGDFQTIEDLKDFGTFFT